MRYNWLRAAGACALILAPRPVPAQSVVGRTPSMWGAWLSPPGVVQFNFVHRFRESGAPEHRISNSPTFLTAIRAPRLRALVGAVYATNSDVVPRMPNEWEFFLRAVPLPTGNPLADVSLHLGYNQAARSVDAELGASRRLGPVRLLSAVRTFSNAFDLDQRRFAVAGGLVFQWTRFIAVAGDLAALHQRSEDERPAWSAGIQLGVPSTPHSFSLHATNATTGTLQGASRGGGQLRVGFEYTVPITLARYGGRSAPRPADASDGAAAPAGGPGGVISARMQDFAFTPARLEITAGTMVVWTNDGSVPHTVTADDGRSFESGLVVAGGGIWSFRFERPGTYPFHCAPHPFMRGEVVVR